MDKAQMALLYSEKKEAALQLARELWNKLRTRK